MACPGPIVLNLIICELFSKNGTKNLKTTSRRVKVFQKFHHNVIPNENHLYFRLTINIVEMLNRLTVKNRSYSIYFEN
jgi:hypothetical protein